MLNAAENTVKTTVDHMQSPFVVVVLLLLLATKGSTI